VSNLHRLAWIDIQVRNQTYPNCTRIAQQFEISVRQAARDIEYLRDTMGAPICYCPKHNGYYYSEPTYVLPAQLVTETEKQTLSYLAYHYHYIGSVGSLHLAELFKRLSGGSTADSDSGHELPVLQVKPKEPLVFEILRQAIATRVKVNLSYSNNKGEISRRVVAPYKLFVKSRVSYLVGFCELRSEIRVFRVDRIKDSCLAKEGFMVVSWFNPDNYGDVESFNYYQPYQAQVKFEQPVTAEMLKMPIEAVEGFTYRVQFFNSVELLRILLALPFDFTIESPGWLRERLRKKLEQIYHNNFSPNY